MATHMCAGYFENDGRANVVHGTYIVKPRAGIRWISNSAAVVAPLIITRKFIVANNIAAAPCGLLPVMSHTSVVEKFQFPFFNQLTLFTDLLFNK